jgi:hypothetical protein
MQSPIRTPSIVTHTRDSIKCIKWLHKTFFNARDMCDNCTDKQYNPHDQMGMKLQRNI